MTHLFFIVLVPKQANVQAYYSGLVSRSSFLLLEAQGFEIDLLLARRDKLYLLSNRMHNLAFLFEDLIS